MCLLPVKLSFVRERRAVNQQTPYTYYQVGRSVMGGGTPEGEVVGILNLKQMVGGSEVGIPEKAMLKKERRR